MKVLQLNETITYTHNGVEIYMHLDYEKGLVSFVEKDGTKKKWLFTDRGRDYLGGWEAIFSGLKEATLHADTRLKEQAEVREKLAVDRVVKWQKRWVNYERII